MTRTPVLDSDFSEQAHKQLQAENEFARQILTPLTPPAPLTPLEMASPGRAFTQPGLSYPDKRTRKPNSVLCGHSSRRRVAADVHQRPTRRFRPLHGAAFRRRAGTEHEPCSLAHASLPIWSCSVWGLPCRSHYCLRGALLPHLFTLTGLAVQANALRASLPAPKRERPAVCFLWHWPSTGLDARVPDVIRHTALWSSDFPLPKTPACAETSGSDRPVLLPVSSLPRIRLYQLR